MSSPVSLKPCRLDDGPLTYVFTYTRDLAGDIVIDKIYVFDAAASRYGEALRFESLPDRIKMRYWGLLG